MYDWENHPNSVQIYYIYIYIYIDNIKIKDKIGKALREIKCVT